MVNDYVYLQIQSLIERSTYYVQNTKNILPNKPNWPQIQVNLRRKSQFKEDFPLCMYMQHEYWIHRI